MIAVILTGMRENRGHCVTHPMGGVCVCLCGAPVEHIVKIPAEMVTAKEE